MIGKLKGIVDSVGEDEAVIDVNGVGYLIAGGARTVSRLEPGKPVIVHIETHVREDQLKLFAFTSDSERAWFVHLQSVQGVGAKHALAILDAIEIGEIENAVILGDATVFERAKGVGKKLAQRIITELKDKAPPSGRARGAGATELNIALTSAGSGASPSSTPSDGAVRNTAVSALVNLGYGEGDARRAVAEADRVLGDEIDEVDEAQLIKAALKELAL